MAQVLEIFPCWRHAINNMVAEDLAMEPGHPLPWYWPNPSGTLSHNELIRADSRFAPSQWETVLLCNDIGSHWLGASLESALVSTGFPQLLKNHWNSDLFQDHGKIIEFYEKFLKFVKMKKSWKNHWISDQLLMEKSLNSEIDIVLTKHIDKWICILHIHYLLIYHSSNEIGRLCKFP